VQSEKFHCVSLETALKLIHQTHTPLPYIFNVRNTSQLINDLTDIPYDHNLRLVSFDITNMYINIPTNELLGIINSVCNNYVEENLKHILKLSKIIMDQNYDYFDFEDKTYLQHEGLATGAPKLPVLSPTMHCPTYCMDLTPEGLKMTQ
jgi:hypothetical protein